jgi:hypothetical protein
MEEESILVVNWPVLVDFDTTVSVEELGAFEVIERLVSVRLPPVESL